MIKKSFTLVSIMTLMVCLFSSSLIYANESGTVTNNNVRVRTEPNTNSTILGDKDTNAVVSVISKEGEWYKLQLDNGQVGYMFAQYVNVNEAKLLANAVPVAALTTEGTTPIETTATTEGITPVETTATTVSAVAPVASPIEPVVTISKADLTRQALVDFALEHVGLSYSYGGTNLKRGVDCSGFTLSVFKEFSYSLNRSSSAQSNNGVAVAIKDLKPGDLVFYGYSSSISHVALYIGNGKIVHSSTRGKGVVTNTLYNMGSQRIITTRRIIAD